MKWENILKEEYKKEYFLNLMKFLDNEYEMGEIFPEKRNIFRALKMTEYDEVKVVILGQDPYHDINQANGLAFSINKGAKFPPSLRNIYKELEIEYGKKVEYNGNLENWAKQGVLLLNTILTVKAHNANSHKGIGWEKFTDSIISKLNERKDPIIFILWGNNAREKKKLITNSRHYILESVHPSPLSANRGFFGNDHFKKANQKLKELNKGEIKWI